MRLLAALSAVCVATAQQVASERNEYLGSAGRTNAFLAFDNDVDTAWISSGVGETYLELRLSRPSRVHEYTLILPMASLVSGENIPAEFYLEGGNGAEYTKIDHQKAQNATLWAGTKITYALPDNDNRYSRYRVVFLPATSSSSSSSSSDGVSVAISELHLGGHISGSSQYSDRYRVENVFDNYFDAQMWISYPWLTPAWVEYNFRRATKIVKYTLLYINGAVRTRIPTDYELRGLRPDGIWEILDRQVGRYYSFWGKNTLFYMTHEIQNPGEYVSYRLIIHDDDDYRHGVVVISLGAFILQEEGKPDAFVPSRD